MRRTVLLVSGTALLMGLLTGPANAASAPGSCPTPYFGPADFGAIMETKQVMDALAAGIYDEDLVRIRFDQVDINGDAMICWKTVGNENQFRSLYAGNYIDNNAAPK